MACLTDAHVLLAEEGVHVVDICHELAVAKGEISHVPARLGSCQHLQQRWEGRKRRLDSQRAKTAKTSSFLMHRSFLVFWEEEYSHTFIILKRNQPRVQRALQSNAVVEMKSQLHVTMSSSSCSLKQHAFQF